MVLASAETRLKILPVLTREPYTSLLHLLNKARLGGAKWHKEDLGGARRG
jgi:hypothetical protein